MNLKLSNLFIFGIIVVSIGCKKENTDLVVKDPYLAEKVSIDRFSELHGHLMIRTAENGLPEANEPINFDTSPFITQSFGPDGNIVKYYNFDVQSLAPAPIYAFFKPNSTISMRDQLNIIDVIPGELTYSDFWQVFKVNVPESYVANTVTSFQEIVDQNFTYEKLNMIVNCPIVPLGSTATKNILGNGNDLHWGWYKNMVVYYFTFEEKALTTTANDLVPISPIYVTFNENPDENNPNSGPASGFVTETGSDQTHNVIATVPSDADYSPLWSVQIYNNSYFESVHDLNSAQTAEILMGNAAYVNCPVVYIASK